MTLKKKLGMGIASAVLGAALVGGGTFAYFSDKEVSNNTFAAGTLDLSLNPQKVIDVDNLKPGDSVLREFKLANKGTLNIKEVKLLTDYKITDAKGDNNGEDLAKHINVKFFWNWDKQAEPVYELTLDKLKNLKEAPDLVAQNVFSPEWAEKGGLLAGDEDTLWVQLEFVENKEDQNKFQGDGVQLDWTFNATQEDGTEK